jgi:hypothetical protein
MEWRMKDGRITSILMIVLGVSASFLRAESSPLSDEACSAAFAERAHPGHELVTVQEVIRVRHVRGHIESEAGAWPPEPGIVFQLFGPSGSSSLHLATVGETGKLEMSDVPAGKYCFHVSAVGWNQLTGRLEVSPEHASDARLLLKMSLGN